MPFCAHCGWGYQGAPHFCRQCGRPLYRSPAWAGLEVVPAGEPAAAPPGRAWPAALFALGLAAGAAYLLTGLAGATTAASSFPLDEAWVRLVYARSLAQTGAPEFNAGLPDPGVGSLLWVALLAVLIKTLGALGISVIAMAKGASLLAGAAAAPLAAELTRRLTLSRLAGLAAGALVALDPTFAFASAGGIEATLVASLAVGALLAFMSRRPALCGALLGLAILTRLEAAGLAALLGLAAAGPLARGLIERRRSGLAWPDRASATWRDWRGAVGPLVAVGGPVAAVLLWLALYGASTAWMLPRVPDVALPHLPSPLALWRGYLEPWVGLLGGALPVGLAPIALGAVVLARSRGLLGLAVGLAPLMLALGATAVAPPGPGPWPFALRHRVDPILPLVAVLLVIGLRAIWRGGLSWQRGLPAAAPGRSARALGVVAAALLATGAPIAASLGLWADGPADYLRQAGWLADTYVAAGRLARDAVPEEALIAALEPGAVRYVSRRPVADLTGQHTPTIEAREAVDALLEARAPYAALPLRPAFESLPSASLLRRLGEGDDAIGLFRVALGGPSGPRESPYAFPTEALRRLDYLDVGNEVGERSHGYVPAGLVEGVRRSSRIRPDAAVEDDGRRLTEGESFELQVEPGRDLILARRYEATAPTPLRLTVDGQPAGEWTPRAGRYVLAEETVRVPGGLLRRGRVSVAVQVLSGQATSFGYWAFAER